jgi:hypothetical protein
MWAVSCSACGRECRGNANWFQKTLDRLAKKGKPFLCEKCLKGHPVAGEGKPEASAQAEPKAEPKPEASQETPKAEAKPAAPAQAEPKAAPRKGKAQQSVSARDLLAKARERSKARAAAAAPSVSEDLGAEAKEIVAKVRESAAQSLFAEAKRALTELENSRQSFVAKAANVRDLQAEVSALGGVIGEAKRLADDISRGRGTAEDVALLKQMQAAIQGQPALEKKLAAAKDGREAASGKFYRWFRTSEEVLGKFSKPDFKTGLGEQSKTETEVLRQSISGALQKSAAEVKGIGFKIQRKLAQSLPAASKPRQPKKSSSGKKGTMDPMDLIGSSRAPKTNGTGVSGLRVASSSPAPAPKAKPKKEEAEEQRKPAAPANGTIQDQLQQLGLNGSQPEKGSEAPAMDPSSGQAEAEAQAKAQAEAQTIAAAQAAVMAETKKKTRRGKRG